jgi:alpha-mannosidase
MPTGTPWGAKWEYCWFRAKLVVPRSAKGERLALSVDTGGESIIFINGTATGAKGYTDREITLTRCAKGGETFDILIESYGGHGPMECGGGPCPDGTAMVPEPAPSQTKVGTTTFGLWEEELYQLWFDAQTLLQLRDGMLDKESLRVAEIDDALRQLTLVVDLELPRTEMMATVRAGRQLLQPLLACRNGSTSPLMTCFGHSHIDVAWLWPLQETERKCGRTFSSQLALMDEYPEYKFLQSQTHLYWMTKTRYPELYARIKRAIRKGQWIPDGAMWVEADTNVTGGESLIRQFIHGKRFFKEEFGVNSELMWLPDVFGYSGAMPQIMAGCGIKYFSTQKIFWTYNGGDPFPYNLFWWEGIDGTKVLSYLHNDYNSETKPASILQRWHERVQKDSSHKGRLLPFGWGDGGGGPTRQHLEFLRRLKNLEGMPRCEMAAPVKFLKTADNGALPTWVGELYFQAHRGTYTSQARTKRGNRLCEIGLRELELWGAAAAVLARYRYPLQKADRLWKDVLLCQFHDIIPGSSIHRVYEESEALHADVLAKARALADTARTKLLKADKDAITVFNSLGFKRDALLELPRGFPGVATADGTPIPSQKTGSRTFALVKDVPACGWTSLRRAKPAKIPGGVRATPDRMENEFLALTLNATGEVISILDKQSGREMAAGPCNSFHLYKDVPGWFDAWDIDSMYKQQPVDLDRTAAIEVTAEGPVFASLRVTRKINKSSLVQDIVLRAGSRRVDFRTRVDWRESHKLLKVNFPVTVSSKDALHDIQFGHLRRPTHATLPYDASRFEVCNNKWTALTEEARGAAVLNDCKYGVSVEGNSINLTLLKSALAPDMTADKGAQEFTYAFYCWNGPFKEGGLHQSAYDLNMPVTSVAGFGTRLDPVSLFDLDANNVVIETVKPAEDGSGDIVVRLYESARTATRCVLHTTLPVRKVLETDMLEKTVRVIDRLGNGGIELDFRPFEIKTLRLAC